MYITKHARQRFYQRFPYYCMDSLLEDSVVAGTKIRSVIYNNLCNIPIEQHNRTTYKVLNKHTYFITFVIIENRLVSIFKVNRRCTDLFRVNASEENLYLSK